MDKTRRILPPVYFLTALVLMAGLHFLFPIGQILRAPYSYGGVLAIVAGIVIVLWAARLFHRAGTAIKPFEESSVLVTDGPYKWTRNPMYLGLVVALVGAGLVLGTASPFMIIPAFGWLIQQRFIQPEEAGLERTFGSVYMAYKREVRRWL